jgi:hypothetical protein
MKGMYDFIVEPLGKRYNNTVDIEGVDLVVNTSIESFKSVNNIGVVLALPKAFKTDISIGDQIMIHHNVFRRFYDMRGNEKNSRSYLNENMYLCAFDQIYLYKKDGGDWITFGDRCFVKPICSTNEFDTDLEEPHIGIVKYDNKKLNSIGIKNEMLVTFKPHSEFEFIVDNQRLYCMKSNDIVIKHEYEGNEKEYNPSWA